MAKFAVFGTGTVGQTLAGRLSDLGNTVMVGTRNVTDTLARTEKDMYGNPPFVDWLKDHASVRTGTYEQAAGFGEIILNCTTGHASL